ncbi:hypothetical protein MLD38_031238 [Melastoma candidum]|uniref:Uncharacterized protein n=1 Tax=Melastoma candidum TaxID=119954 RepID=A0ACB9MP33_9MYRT|nr:hypothetical protein MLD38_031238 [Melastoma candidum]
MANSRQVVLVAFFILCFITINTANGRSLRQATTIANPGVLVDKDMLQAMETEAEGDDFESSDYSPTRKKSPIHN